MSISALNETNSGEALRPRGQGNIETEFFHRCSGKKSAARSFIWLPADRGGEKKKGEKKENKNLRGEPGGTITGTDGA